MKCYDLSANEKINLVEVRKLYCMPILNLG